MIPYWLIIMGTVSLCLSLTKILSNFKIMFQSNQSMNKTLENQKPIIFDIEINNVYFVLTIFILFFWFIIGNLWIYSKFSEVTYNKIAKSNNSYYCDHTTYWLSFWTVTIINIFIEYFIV